jgi:hypothetical protein
VVDYWASAVESSSALDFLSLHAVWALLGRLTDYKIMSILSVGCDFTTKSGGIWKKRLNTVRELDANKRKEPSMRRQIRHLLALGGAIIVVLAVTRGSTAAPPIQSVQVTNTPLPVQVTNPSLAVTVTSGEPVNAFTQLYNNLGNQVDIHALTIPAGGMRLT